MRLAPLALVVLAGCQREERSAGHPSHVYAEPARVRTHPGVARPLDGVPLESQMPGYEETAFDVAEGKHLYTAFNCIGCHAAGGGAIGPALIDRTWRYGSEPYEIATTIVAGRPRGMPAYRGKLPRKQLYQLVAYVRALGGFVRGDAVSPRDVHIKKKNAPNLTDEGWPKLPEDEP